MTKTTKLYHIKSFNVILVKTSLIWNTISAFTPFCKYGSEGKGSKNLLTDVCSFASEAFRPIWVNIPIGKNLLRCQEIKIEPILMIDIWVWLWYEEGNFTGSELLESTLSEAINRLGAGPLWIKIEVINMISDDVANDCWRFCGFFYHVNNNELSKQATDNYDGKMIRTLDESNTKAIKGL